MDNITLGVSTLIIGLSIVMLILAAISIIVSCFKFLDKKEKTKPAPEVAPPAPVVVETVQENAPSDNFEETVCAITAALAAFLDTNESNVCIKSIKKVATQGSSNWGRQARNELNNRRLV